MAMEPYRRLLALPGVRSLLLVGLLARIPSTAVAITLTMHVVDPGGLGLGFGAAGLVTMASTVGMAVGSPLAGRFVDRHGLRPVLAVTTLAQLVFWSHRVGDAVPRAARRLGARGPARPPGVQRDQAVPHGAGPGRPAQDGLLPRLR